MQRTCDVDHIRYGRLDAVAAALDLAHDARHLVAVFRVVDGLGAGDVDDLRHLVLCVYRVIGAASRDCGSYCCWLAVLCTARRSLARARLWHADCSGMRRLRCGEAPAF